MIDVKLREVELTLKALNVFFIKTMETKGFILISYHHKCLIWLLPIHLNTYVMGLWPLEIFLLLQRRDSRQNLMSTDVRF